MVTLEYKINIIHWSLNNRRNTSLYQKPLGFFVLHWEFGQRSFPMSKRNCKLFSTHLYKKNWRFCVRTQYCVFERISMFRVVTNRNLQFVLREFGLQLFYPLDIISLFQTTITTLVPVVQDFFQVAYLQFLQIHCVKINLLLYKNESGSQILLLQKIKRWQTTYRNVDRKFERLSSSASHRFYRLAATSWVAWRVLPEFQ